MTAALALNPCQYEAIPYFPGNHIHASQSQNACQCNLGPDIHLQVPHQESWQNPQSEITEGGGDTVDIGHGNDVVEIHASSGDLGFLVHHEAHALPEELDGLALQSQHEPEDDANDAGDGDDGPDNVFMGFGDGQAEQRESDGDLGQGTCPDIAGLTEPPPLGGS